MQKVYRQGKRLCAVALRRVRAGRFEITVDGTTSEVEAELVGPSALRVVIDGHGRTVRVARVGSDIHVAVDGTVHVFSPDAGPGTDGGTKAIASPDIVAPMTGKVLQVLVAEGQTVEAGDGLLIVEAMKMENRIVAEARGTVRKIRVAEGQVVNGGDVLLELEYPKTEPAADRADGT